MLESHREGEIEGKEAGSLNWRKLLKRHNKVSRINFRKMLTYLKVPSIPNVHGTPLRRCVLSKSKRPRKGTKGCYPYTRNGNSTSAEQEISWRHTWCRVHELRHHDYAKSVYGSEVSLKSHTKFDQYSVTSSMAAKCGDANYQKILEE